MTGWPVCEPLHHNGAVKVAQFSPDGKRVITASDDRAVRVWDAVGSEALGIPFLHGLALRAEFSPEGNRLVTAANRGMARVWDARSGRPLSPSLQHGTKYFGRSSVQTAKCSLQLRWITPRGFGMLRPVNRS